MTNSQITIQQAVCNCQQRLIENSDSPQLEVEVLLAHVLQSNRTYLRTWPEKLLTTQQLAQLEGFIERRNNGEPIAYITGEREFWGMSLHVSPDTLIPRPETETLVELALERIPRDAEWQIADLGTGSGAIALAIARERPRCLVLATDISPAALAMARHNATRLGLDNLRFADGAWCTALGNERLEMILSNPPYVAPGDPHLQQGDLRFEPPAALASA
ncbi:MAG TPA: peptide chain release factor N(5)-glutamine methyltransferase, partial [Gammaproteobacteria bacterium]|nr:peptide chain release factor N(5)-glutamine methyltransferase [Gammaproteobacteria bacterium]